MKRTVVILLVLLMGLLTACAVPPKTEANVTDPDAMMLPRYVRQKRTPRRIGRRA